MNINEYYSGQFAKASDLQGRTVRRRIVDAIPAQVAGKHRLALILADEAGTIGGKKLLLNVTNARALGEAFGPESDAWKGRMIEIYPAMTDYAGHQVPALRVRTVPEAQAPATPTGAPGAPAGL